MFAYMPDGFLNAVNDADSKNIIEKFRVKILFTGLGSVNNPCRSLVKAKLNGVFFSAVNQSLFEHRKKFICNLAVDEQNLLCIANRRSACLCVFDNIERHIKVGIIVNINMANTRARLNNGNSCVLNTSLDKTCSASRDQKINISVGSHKLR